MKTFEYLKKLISHTPLVDITYKFDGKTKHVYAKCEWYSLTGSIKDKSAYQIFYDAYKSGTLKKGDPLVEVSSGNMGISISALGNILGNPVTILMPKSMSEERKKLIRLYGATLIETEDFHEAFDLCEKYVLNGYFCTRQFENISNKNAHAQITAREILEQTKDKKFNAFVCGLGTSGTFSGIGSVLKNDRKTKVIAIEPENARIITGVPPFGKHKLQGLSDEILPKLFDNAICDEVIQITDDDAIAMSIKLCRTLSLGVGISSGANFLGCVLSGENAVTIFSDDNKKYLSTDLSKDITTELVKKIEIIGFDIIK